MFLLDTNVISELRKTRRADRHVVDWAAALPVSSLYISTITLLELEIGVLRMERRDPDHGKPLRDWLENHVLLTFEGRILAVDAPVARCCARLHVPDPVAERDGLIAATALVHGMTVVTRNVADFVATGAPTLNPWLPAPP